jgi:integrase
MALTDTAVRNAKPSGKSTGDKLSDGEGMYLLVRNTSDGVSKYWRMDYRVDGKRKTLALGTYPAVSLAKARKRRDEAREQLADGIDPGIIKREKKKARAIAASHTFGVVAKEWLAKTAARRATSTQEKVAAWLKHDVLPQIGKKPISEIGPRDVLAAVQIMEGRGAIDSAHRVKQICGQIFRYAVASGIAERDVTADLRGALSAIPKSNYAAITDPVQAGALMRAIDGYGGHPYARAALQLSPLLFVRPGELRSAEWVEFDLDGAEWRIPGAKMKMGVDHIVPLSTQAVEVLLALKGITGRGRFVFPSLRTSDRCMSENTINACLRSMGYAKSDMTAHGFRAMARTILDEVLGERVDLIEHQLAHAVKDPNGRAYNRTAHLPARRAMMQRWADYLDKLRSGADILPFAKGTL